MIRRLVERALPLVGRVGADPNDSDEVKLLKSSLVLSSVMFIFAGAVWGALYFWFAAPINSAVAWVRNQ